MSILYKSKRVGLRGEVFTLLKFRTLKESVTAFPTYRTEEYLPFGKFLRKSKLDELPQLWNWVKRDLNLVGPRAEEERTYEILPEETRRILTSVRPGLTSLASLHYFDEGNILEQSDNVHRDYWEKIKPQKITLDVFYIQNRSALLDLAIIWGTVKKILWSIIKK